MNPTKKLYLIHFVKEHLTFRWPEFRALAKKYRCEYNLSTVIPGSIDDPYVVVETSDVNTLEQCVANSVLAKSLSEILAYSPDSHEDLCEKVGENLSIVQNDFTKQSFRINVESYGFKASQEYKIQKIEKMHFLSSFKGEINLKNPEQVYCLFEYYGDDPNLIKFESKPKRLFFTRWLTDGNRSIIKHFSLRTRKFIANTSMDPTLSLIMANVANIKENSLVYDPFVGSGSLLIGAAHRGAYVLGSDINFLLLHGRSKPSRQGLKTREPDESVRCNLAQYNLDSKYLDVLVSDAAQSPFRSSLKIDAIITDPPYGIRESTEKVGTQKVNPLPFDTYAQHYPSKIDYKMRDILTDLLNFAANHIVLGGRLVYWLPVSRQVATIEEHIPEHKCFELISFSEQTLTLHLSRVMIVMEKISSLDDAANIYGRENLCKISNLLDTNFREKYLSIDNSKKI